MVRTRDFHSRNRGSIPLPTTNFIEVRQDMIRDLEIRVRVLGDKVNWKITPIPRNARLSEEELERAGDALDTVRAGVLARKGEKFGSSGCSRIEKIMAQINPAVPEGPLMIGSKVR